jgi:hypothetical protein
MKIDRKSISLARYLMEHTQKQLNQRTAHTPSKSTTVINRRLQLHSPKPL